MAQKHRVDWDATAGRNGGAQQNSVGNIEGDGKIQWQIKISRSRSLSFGSGSGKGIGAGQSSCGLGLGNALQNPKEDFASAVGVLRPPVRRMCGRAAHDHHSCPARVQVNFLLVRIVLQDAFHEVTKIYPPLKLKFLYMTLQRY